MQWRFHCLRQPAGSSGRVINIGILAFAFHCFTFYLNDFLKRATGAGALFAANDYNFGIRPANILPVGDLTGIDFADLLLCQPSYCVSGLTAIAIPSKAIV